MLEFAYVTLSVLVNLTIILVVIFILIVNNYDPCYDP